MGSEDDSPQRNLMEILSVLAKEVIDEETNA
jgi:hypothetical protein